MNKSRPIQTDSQSLGDIGETTVQLILRKYKWTADIIKSDFGEDIDCNVFIDNSRTNYHLRCQVKSTKKDSEYVKELKDGNYSVSIDSNILRAWLTSFFPVFLIVYEEESDQCYWCNPVNQILHKPSKLEKEKPSIHISKENKFDLSSKQLILDEIKNFYRKIQRLDESYIECEILPVLMPNYKIIPFHNFSNFLYKETELKPKISGNLIELLPSWISVLRKIEPTNILTFIKLQSSNTDINDFLNKLKSKLSKFEYEIRDNEWISFIISPIKIQSTNSSWSNEITYWTSYSKIDSNIVNDFEFNFVMPDKFISQNSKRARSWDFFHFICPKKDISMQFFGTHEITQTIKMMDKIHDNNIKGQIVFWECFNEDIKLIYDLIIDLELNIQIIEEKENKSIIAITTVMFDPFIGMYSMPMDWDSFESGNVKNKLIKNDLIELLPGEEYKKEIPEYISNALNVYSKRDYKNVMITEIEYISGFPLILSERMIQVSRFQMIHPSKIEDIEKRLKDIIPLSIKDFNIEFGIKDDSMWKIPIYELIISWTPEIFESSKDSYIRYEKDILDIFNSILPTNRKDKMDLKDTYEILHIAGEIGFENIESQ